MLPKVKQMLVALLAIVAASPATELQAALSDISTIPHAERQNIRYVSAYNSDPVVTGRVLSFWSNHLSNSRRLIPVTQVGNTLFRLDIRNYQWPRDSWESLQKIEPYFRHPWTGEAETQQLWKETNSSGAIFRADWFLFHTSIEPFYSKFLGLPGTLAELKTKYRVDETGARQLSLQEGGAVLRSIVALNNRRLERLPTLTGYWWQSYDFDSSAAADNVVENLLDVKPDAGEFIWSLPNGMQGYYLANGQGKQVREAPANIAQDTQTPFRNKSVVNARGCVQCHSAGINQFRDIVREMLGSGNLDVRSYDYAKAQAVDDFYRGDLTRQQIQDDCDKFQSSVKSLCGVSSDQVAGEFTHLVHEYAEQPVTLAMAAKEIGCTEDQLSAAIKRTYAGTLLVLGNGQGVARDAWEAAFPVAAVAVRGAK